MSDKPRNLAFNSLPAISSSSSKSLKYDSRSSPPPRITHSPPRLKKVKSESLISSPVSQGKFSKFLNKSRKSSILALNTRSATATASTLPSPQFNSTNQLLFNPNKLKVHESFTNIQDEDFEQSSSKSRVKPRILNSTDKSSVLKDKTRHRIKKTTSDALKIHKLTSQNPKENKEKSKALDIFQDYKPKEPIGMENRHSSKKTNDTRAELVPTLPTSASASSLLKIFSSDNEDINSDRATDALIDSSEVETDIAESPKARYKSIKRQQKKKFCDNNENSQDSQEEEEKPRYNKTGHIHNLDYSSDLSPAPSSPTMNALYGEVPLIDDIGAEYDGEGEEEEDDKEKEENIEEEGKENKGEDEDEDEDEEINDEDKKNAHDKEPEKDEIKIKNEKEGMVEEIMEKDVEDIKLDIDNEDEESDEIFTNRSQYGQDNRSRQSQRQSEEKSQPREDSVPRRAIQGSATPNSNSRSVSPGIAISRRPNRKDRDANGRTKLMKMCDKGKFDEVEELLNLGASVNERDYAGSTALHEAALKGHRRIVRLLLDHNAIIDIRSGPDVLDTPLIDAASNDHLSTVKLLLSRGANPRVINARGQSAIDCVSDDMPNAREIRQLLKEASGKFRHYKETTDISSVPAGTFPDPARHGLNNHGTASSAKPRRSGARAQAMRNDLLWMDYASKGGREVLYDHASEGDIEYIGIALEGGYKPDAECLTLAAKHGHTDVVGLLLAFGAKPNALNEEGETALQQTIGRGHLKTVNLLLQSGADPYKADRCGKTCFDIVGSDDEEMDLLRSFSPKPDLANASTSTIMAKSASTSIPTQKTSSAVEIQKKYCYSDDFSDRKVKKRRLIQHSEFNDRNIDEEKSLKKNVEEDKLIKFKTGDSKAKYDDKASKRLAEDHKPDKETIDEEKFSPSPASLLTASIVSVSPVVTDNSVLYASTSSTNMTPACSSGLPLRGNPATMGKEEKMSFKDKLMKANSGFNLLAKFDSTKLKKERGLERDRERERKLEKEREVQPNHEKEIEREQEKENEREIERKQQLEKEREAEQERRVEQERELERQRLIELELQRNKERETEIVRASELKLELERQKVLEQAREEERLKAREVSKEKEREAIKQRKLLEAQKEKARKQKQRETIEKIEEAEKRRDQDKKREIEEMREKVRQEKIAEEARLAEETEKGKIRELRLQWLQEVEARRNLPYGIREAVFEPRSITQINEYLPLLYHRSLDPTNGQMTDWVIDFQVYLMLGINDIYQTYPSLTRKLIGANEKIRLWSNVIPLLCRRSTLFDTETFEEILQRREDDRLKYMAMPSFWLRYDEVLRIIETEYKHVFGCVISNSSRVAIDLDYEVVKSENSHGSNSQKTGLKSSIEEGNILSNSSKSQENPLGLSVNLKSPTMSKSLPVSIRLKLDSLLLQNTWRG